MSRLPLLLMATLALVAPPVHGADAPVKPASVAGKPADVYVITKVMKMHLTIPAKAFAAMQPTRGGFGGPGMGKQPAPKAAANAPAIDAFVVGRIESVTAQLAGKRKGTVVRAFGGPGFWGFDPAAADKDKDGTLDEAELAEALRDLVPPPQFGPRPPAPKKEDRR